MDKVAVQDANLLIDLELAQLFDVWFKLGIETHTTSFVARELRLGDHLVALSYVESRHIVSHDLDASEVGAVVNLRMSVGGGLSLTDCSVLYIADKLGALVPTGDAALRDASHDRHVPVHGTLWIMDILVDNGLIGMAIAAAKLELLLNAGRRLPKEACKERIERWRSQR